MNIHHFAIEVRDLETSIAFYQKYLGLHEENRLQFNKENIVFLANNDFRIELISGGQQNVSQSIHICLEVDNVHEIIRKFNEHHISALEGPYKLNNGWETVFYTGPDNEVIEFLQIREKAEH
ncbi:VOC family protein [Neobacillus niacini]|uniref:VOC family protein n=1 Tax=Neobacillus niacini TaxID=86668 RepID=UPI00203B1732|nr:VOC family protein [Neobacillus niacini]MCM3692287.1 VOC family protein [Neobacillus niacini]